MKLINESAYYVPTAEARKEAVTRLRKLRETRNQKSTVDALTDMFHAEERGENVVRAGIDACKSYATVGEMVGVLRLAHGFPYYHYRTIKTPEYLKHLEKQLV